jgi:small GTP-binding protein
MSKTEITDQHSNINQASIPGLNLRHTLLGHRDKITRIAWSPRGDTLATPSLDGDILLWDLEKGEKRTLFRGNRNAIFCVTWSPDGQRIALATDDNIIRLANLKTGKWHLDYKGHSGSVYSIAWSPNGLMLASASKDRTTRLWSSGHQSRAWTSNIPRVVAWSPNGELVASGDGDGIITVVSVSTRDKPIILRGHSDMITSLAWSPDGKMLISASRDESIRLWNTHTFQLARVLEGHTAQINSISISSDGLFLASKSLDNTVRIWRCDRWEPIAIIDELASNNWLPGIAFNPKQPILATLGGEDKVIRVWDLNVPLLLNTKSTTKSLKTIHHTSAKIVLVGESNVGKTCLALRLSEDRYEEQGTTHGTLLWVMTQEQLFRDAASSDFEKREIVLWDMGGQDEYRLVHQLFLHNTTLALLLLDPTRGRVAFEEIEGWNKGLEKQLQGRNAVKLLIATKLDEDNNTIDVARLERLVKECGFAGYYETSAKTGRGISELRSAIAESLDWESLTKTSRPELFQRIRDQIEQRRLNNEVVLVLSDLIDSLHTDNNKIDIELVDTVVDQLEMQGLIATTSLYSGERALVLQISEIERYAGSIIIAARNNSRGVPAIEEQVLASPKMLFPGINEGERLARLQERIVLECVVQLLLGHGICLRHEGLLIFPSLFQPTEIGKLGKIPHSISLYYDFWGAIDNIYASLVASLDYSEKFGNLRLWEDRAEFEQIGKNSCGLRKVDRGSGFARLDVYFRESTLGDARNLFMSFIDNHLRQHGVEIYEHVEITCACGFPFSEETIRKRVEDDHSDIGCPECDRRTKISEGIQKARKLDPDLERKTWALRTKIEERRKESIEEVRTYFKQPDVTKSRTVPLRILHISDLHIQEEDDPITRLQPLLADLRDKDDGFGLERLDYLVVSGDLTNRARPKEFEKARLLISELIRAFELTAERCVVVPGNHDLDWDEEVYEWVPKRKVRLSSLKEGEYVAQGDGFLIRNNNQYHLRFRNFNEQFYHPLMLQEYPLELNEQCIPFLFSDTKLQFIAMNSCWEVDEFFRDRSSIHSGALSRGLIKADEQLSLAIQRGLLPKEEHILRIGIWHHPVTGNEKIIDDSFLERLRQAGIRVCLHGHIHEDRADIVGYLHPRRKLHIIGAGSFGALASARPEATPRLYNLLEISPHHNAIRVHTRGQRKVGGAWEGNAIWPSAEPNEWLPYYDIKLSKR